MSEIHIKSTSLFKASLEVLDNNISLSKLLFQIQFDLKEKEFVQKFPFFVNSAFLYKVLHKHEKERNF